MKAVARVVLYGKPGCHLCEDARAAVLAVAPGARSSWRRWTCRSIRSSTGATGSGFPVVTLDGEEVFEYFVDPDALARAAR